MLLTGYKPNRGNASNNFYIRNTDDRQQNERVLSSVWSKRLETYFEQLYFVKCVFVLKMSSMKNVNTPTNESEKHCSC